MTAAWHSTPATPHDHDPPYTPSTIEHEHEHDSVQSVHQLGEHRGDSSGQVFEFDGLVLWPEFESADQIGRGGHLCTLRATLSESFSLLLRRTPVGTLGEQ